MSQSEHGISQYGVNVQVVRGDNHMASAITSASAICPICGVVNIARLENGDDILPEDRTLEWWAGAESGTWCPHTNGFIGLGHAPDSEMVVFFTKETLPEVQAITARLHQDGHIPLVRSMGDPGMGDPGMLHPPSETVIDPGMIHHDGVSHTDIDPGMIAEPEVLAADPYDDL